MNAIAAKNLNLGYNGQTLLHNISLEVKRGSFLSIIGANGSGKTTLLKGLSRIIPPISGRVELFGEDMSRLSTKTIAKQLAILPQIHHAQPDIILERLVSYGRHPHLSWRKRFDASDQAVVDWALEVTQLSELRHRTMGQLSGGESQRAWLALALAQEPELLFLDEPTTYLDMVHQLEILETIRSLNQTHAITVIMVHHDLNQALRYSDTILALRSGEILYHLPSAEMLDLDKIEQVFSVHGELYYDPKQDYHFFVPQKIKP